MQAVMKQAVMKRPAAADRENSEIQEVAKVAVLDVEVEDDIEELIITIILIVMHAK